MGNMLVNTRDQKFVLYEQIGIEKLFESDKFKDFSREIVDMMLSEAEKLAVEEILPTYEVGDKQDPVVFREGKTYAPKCYHEPYRKYCEAGWVCSVAPPELGGQGVPISVYSACTELFGAANYAFQMYPGLTLGAAAMIAARGTEVQIEKYALKMFSGEWCGTMCLTEPGAGSDVGNLRTTAKRLPDGTYRITGTKCFISSGDHDLTEQIVHPVLARIEGDPPGTKGISLFIVPKYRVNDDGGLGEFNDVVTGGIEHKMGIKGSATATLNFGDNGSCIGELLGEEREGMKIMFLMMNEARLSTGMQGLDLASVSFEHAVQYAKERIQSRRIEDWSNQAAPPVAIINHPDIRRSLLWMKSHVEGMRAMNYFIAFCIDREGTAATERGAGEDEGVRRTPHPDQQGLLLRQGRRDLHARHRYLRRIRLLHRISDGAVSPGLQDRHHLRGDQLHPVSRPRGEKTGTEQGEKSDEPLRGNRRRDRKGERMRQTEGIRLAPRSGPRGPGRPDDEFRRPGERAWITSSPS